MKRENEQQMFSVRPAKPVSGASAFMLAFMFLFGVGFAILVGNTLYENDASIGLYFVFFVFIVGWLGMVLFMLIYNLQNLRCAKGVPFIEINVANEQADEDVEQGAQGESPKS